MVRGLRVEKKRVHGGWWLVDDVCWAGRVALIRVGAKELLGRWRRKVEEVWEAGRR